AGDVPLVDPGRVELGLGEIDGGRDAVPKATRDGLAAHVPGEGGDEHLVPLGERRQHGAPGFGAERKGVKEEQGLARATMKSNGRSERHLGASKAEGITSHSKRRKAL